MSVLSIELSGPRRTFKHLLGDTNRFLVAILVGLEEVSAGNAKPGPEFARSWSAQNHVDTARQSRAFAIKAALSWVVDAVDAYVGVAHRKPTIFQDDDLVRELTGCGRKVSKKVQLLQGCLAPEDRYLGSMVRLAIIWRNQLVHFLNEDSAPEDAIQTIRKNADLLKSEFYDLDADRMIGRFNSNGVPSFKECLSLIQASHRFVARIDGYALRTLDLDTYIRDVLSSHIREGVAEERIPRIWGQGAKRAKTSIEIICRSQGIVPMEEPYKDHSFIDAAALDELAAMGERGGRRALLC